MNAFENDMNQEDGDTDRDCRIPEAEPSVCWGKLSLHVIVNGRAIPVRLLDEETAKSAGHGRVAGNRK